MPGNTMNPVPALAWPWLKSMSTDWAAPFDCAAKRTGERPLRFPYRLLDKIFVVRVVMMPWSVVQGFEITFVLCLSFPVLMTWVPCTTIGLFFTGLKTWHKIKDVFAIKDLTTMTATEEFSCLRQRVYTLISLIILTPIGFSSKFYQGPAAIWVNYSLGGFFYVVFWCLFFFLVFFKSKPWLISSSVLVATCLLEFLQLWQSGFLQPVRHTFLGSALLGNAFTWSDFPYYFAGSGIGWLWLKWLQKANKNWPPFRQYD